MSNAKPWTLGRVILWVVLTLGAIVWQADNWIDALEPKPGTFLDFSQEWLSAKNYLTGLPIYLPQEQVFTLHTKLIPKTIFLPWNAHPPVSVLLAIPFGYLEYPYAHLAWNLLMVPLIVIAIALVIQELQIPFRLISLLPCLSLAMVSHPLITQFYQGQLNILILFLVTTAWVADRRKRPVLAGLLIGIAAAVKLFPALIFLYWLMQRRWGAIAAGITIFGLLNAIALAMFGSQAFQTYAEVVLPHLSSWRGSWWNLSLSGFWLRNFPGNHDDTFTSWHSVWIPRLCILASQFCVAGLAAYRCWQAVTPQERDAAFALAITGMLLVTPIAWGHYFLILILPMGLCWMRLTTAPQRFALGVILCIMWLPSTSSIFLKSLIGGGFMNPKDLPPITMLQNILVVSVPTYALIGLFALVWQLADARKSGLGAPPAAGESR